MPIERNPCVYILASKPLGTLYAGVTSSLVQRIGQHRERTLGGFTSKYAVKRLVWFEMHGDMENAIMREKQLKNWRRQWKVNLIEERNPTWDDLAVAWGFPPLH